jgi:hypothetical protein
VRVIGRKDVLLKAALDILKQQNDTPKVLNCLLLTVNYEETEHSGARVLADIAEELGISLESY